MCGPSKAAKQLNGMVQDFTKQVTSQAGTIFGAANTVFNNILNATQSIVNGGPSQAGFSENEKNARTAANVEASGTMARNLKGAAASSGAAIGGGNAVTPSGGVQTAVQNAEIQAAASQAANENAITNEDYAVGRDNYNRAITEEEQAPSVYNTSVSANKEAGDQLTAAQTSQQNIDTQNNWWKTDLMKVGMAGVGALTSSFTGGIGAGWAKSLLGGGSSAPSFATGGAGAIAQGN